MTHQLTEKAFEQYIQKALCGEIVEQWDGVFSFSEGYKIGKSEHFDKHYAIDTHYFWQFLEASQNEKIQKIKSYHPKDWQLFILDRIDKTLKNNGILYLLKHGFSLDSENFDMLYPTPMLNSGQQVVENFAKNIFSCTRQVYFSASDNQSIDMVLFINGLPIVTLELKNQYTHQSIFHAKEQYKKRDTGQKIFQSGRCLVHFAVDTDEVEMTTQLSGNQTFFLPFNQGFEQGKGNPPRENNFKTAYLWEEVLTPLSLVNIVEQFAIIQKGKNKSLDMAKIIFPRYHQLDVVRKLCSHAKENGTGHRYLIQHSAGSGKSNSITWLAFSLIEVFQSKEKPLFDSVIVVTDRRILDKQISDNIRNFSQTQGIIAHANHSTELKSALQNGKKIIITTIQKFPFIIDGIADLSHKNFAVIIDEAHSSQSGIASDTMNMAMGKDPDTDINQDLILQAMQGRKMRKNASYFAFTATPKNTTLEKFGEKQEDNSFKPFHLYSMKQAIQEGFILDVLSNYTTYKSYYQLQKSVEDNPLFEKGKAQKKLKKFVEKSKQSIREKAKIMLEHFQQQVVARKKLKGQAKAMILTQDIETAITYFFEIRNLLNEKGNPFKAVVAFSGEKQLDGETYTEAKLNGFEDSKTAEKFDQEEYRILVVANKYLTGFDQPKLCAMYVDKKLDGVLCVQALSRLNRSATKLDKRSEDLFILDFFNELEDIRDAFEPFYTQTLLTSPTDVNVLHDLKAELEMREVYFTEEVEDFAIGFFSQKPNNELNAILDMAVTRFEEIENHDDKADFKIKAKQFVKIYAQVASLIAFDNIEWEKLYWFLRFLIPKLQLKDPEIDGLNELLSSIDLETYALQRVHLNQNILLSDENGELNPQNPNMRGSHSSEEEKEELEQIIYDFNERFFSGWATTPEEQRIIQIEMAKKIKAHPNFSIQYENNPNEHTKNLSFDEILLQILLERRKEDMEFYKRYTTDDVFKSAYQAHMKKIVERV